MELVKNIWVLLMVTAFSAIVAFSQGPSGRSLNKLEYSAPAIKTTSEDKLDCIDLHSQPAFDHDLLVNHKFQKQPSEIPKHTEIKKNSKWKTREAQVSTWPCPAGTVPMREYESSSTSTAVPHPHEHAVIKTDTPRKIYGAKGTMNVWNPHVESEGEMSLGQIWVTSGSYDTNDLNSIEVGWHVSPDLYQDNKTRLFIYWTSDTYKATGCYNLQCPGFIQTSNEIVLGGTLTPVSAFEGDQFEITISVWKDQKSGNWWLSLGSDHILVGYWPAEIFSNLVYAKEVQWGGEIVDSQTFGRHTATEMGSGRFSDEGFGKVAYFRNLEIVEKNRFLPVQNVSVKKTGPKFYNIESMFGDDWGSYIFFGGSGFSRLHSGVTSLEFSSFLLYFSFIIFFII